MAIDSPKDPKRASGWLPGNQEDLETWLSDLSARVRSRGEQITVHPVIAEFQDLIAADPVVRMYMTQMVEQVPSGKPYTKRHLESVDQLLRLINEVLSMAPEFSEDSMVTTPLAAILDWTMGTTAGFAAYRDPRINAMINKVLKAWGEFLSSPESLYVLNDSAAGWMSDVAQQAVGMEQFEHDPADEYWGFTSWNDFFTRRFKEGRRPVSSPKNDKVIVSACESTPYKISVNVQEQNEFWVKAQPYSLADLLANDAAVEEFVGGTIYQSFLSATNYHRWHSPVAGTVVRAFVRAGTYYSEAESEGADAIEPTNSQAYLAHVATRAIILIQADDPVIGLLAVVSIGMLEVSSCVINPNIKAGYHVDKGDELGYFQFGGSTECLIFRADVIDQFAVQAIPQQDSSAGLVQVRSKIATAKGA
jgi:phosphatidylserine decarboxylase